MAPTGQLRRTKTSEVVVDHLLERLFDGRLRSGDRIDIDEVAATLGVSRIPVREALVVLERDGIVATRWHRGVYVEPFDRETIVDDFEVYGLLSSVAVARLAERRDPAVVEELDRLLDELEATSPDHQQQIIELVQQILRVQHRAGGSRRLRAELRSFDAFLPRVFDVTGGRSHDRIVAEQGRVIRAIAAGDAELAARARVEDVKAAGEDVARELERRGIFGPEP
jgi:DNA-binding GntR family transcriptional regulator